MVGMMATIISILYVFFLIDHHHQPHLLLMVKGSECDDHLGGHCCWLELNWSLRFWTFVNMTTQKK